MLYGYGNARIRTIPEDRQAAFNAWRSRLPGTDLKEIEADLSRHLDDVAARPDVSKRWFISNFVGAEKLKTDRYQAISTACGNDWKYTGRFFGLILWRVAIGHGRNWRVERVDRDGELQGKKYTLREENP